MSRKNAKYYTGFEYFIAKKASFESNNDDDDDDDEKKIMRFPTLIEWFEH